MDMIFSGKQHDRLYRMGALVMLAFLFLFLGSMYASLPALLEQNFRLDGSFRGFSNKLHLWMLPGIGALVTYLVHRSARKHQEDQLEHKNTHYNHCMRSANWFLALCLNFSLLLVMYVYIAHANSWLYPDPRVALLTLGAGLAGMFYYFGKA